MGAIQSVTAAGLYIAQQRGAVRLQRVADLMQRFGLIKQRLNVASMIAH